jgi:hypothetical protein
MNTIDTAQDMMKQASIILILSQLLLKIKKKKNYSK